MERRKLGSNGPEITVVGYGAWEAGGDMWGPNESEDSVVEAIRTAIDAGMNWIDTAEVYGRGRSEELVGKALKDRRDDVLLFTKVAPRGSGTGFLPMEIQQAIRASLTRLGTDHVDLFQLHWMDPHVSLEETWGAMAEVQDEGLVRAIGLSNVGREKVELCLPIRHVDSVQNKLSLIHRDDREELLPWLAGAGVGYLAYSPLGLGILTGAIGTDTEFHPGDFRGRPSGPRDFRPGTLERHLARVERMRPIAERLGVTVAQLSLRWVIEQRGVTAAIAGSRNARHVRGNAAAGDLSLDDETLAEIDAIWA